MSLISYQHGSLAVTANADIDQSSFFQALIFVRLKNQLAAKKTLYGSLGRLSASWIVNPTTAAIAGN